MHAEPLLLVPGIAADHTVWQDMPPGQLAVSNAATIATMAEDILAAAPPRFALAAHSLGGYVALAIAARAPARVTRLALISTTAAPDSDARRAARARLIDLAHQDFDALAPRLATAMLCHAAPRLHALLTAMLRRAGAAAFIRQQRAAMHRPDARHALGTLAMPTLVLAGASDRIVAPACSAALAAAIPGARHLALPRCGHIPQLEAAAATGAALRAWLG